MNQFRQITVALLIILGAGTFVNSLQAQQEHIPGVTDITSVTTVSALDPDSFVRFIKKGCQDSSSFVGQVHNLKGIVGHRQDLGSYTISYALPDAIDSQYTFILCNWPQAANWLGRSVTFSGRRYLARGILPTHGGETTLYLYLTAVRPHPRLPGSYARPAYP